MVREKSVKSQGVLFQTKSGHPEKCLTKFSVFFGTQQIKMAASSLAVEWKIWADNDG